MEGSISRQFFQTVCCKWNRAVPLSSTVSEWLKRSPLKWGILLAPK